MLFDPTRHCWCLLRAGQAGVAAWLAIAGSCPPALAQVASVPPASPRATPGQPLSIGVEVGFGSGHADRGFVISDGPVIQPVAWVSGALAEFSVWSSFTLAPTVDSSRPQIVELELTRERRWKRFTIAPAVRMYFYHDPLNIETDRSLEGWLFLSYAVGPFRLFINHSLDVLTYRGAYFGEAGIESERRLSPRVEVGGSVGAGWASSRFNQAYAEVAQSALDRIKAEAWLTAHVNPRCYIGPHLQYSTIVNGAVRAQLTRPTFVLLGLTTGVEF